MAIIVNIEAINVYIGIPGTSISETLTFIAALHYSLTTNGKLSLKLNNLVHEWLQAKDIKAINPSLHKQEQFKSSNIDRISLTFQLTSY